MNHHEVFKIRTENDFKKIALEVFRLQANQNSVYKKYIGLLKVNPDKVKNIEQIPFLPIEFFKRHKVITKSGIRNQESEIFLSSGTTGIERSTHYVSDVKLYRKDFFKCFEIFYGDVKKYSLLAFLPSYYENRNSSLLYMVNDLMKSAGNKESRFYRQDEQKILLKKLDKLLLEKKKVILLGVSYALLDLAEKSPFSFSSGKDKSFIIIETGGMKGRKQELTREELHKILCKKFGVKTIHSEYGMTELLSQAYSHGQGKFSCPPWMKILIRDVNDPFSFLPVKKTGAINIIDLANIHSCAFIATQDIGKMHDKNSFEVMGRMDNSDLRGCNLLAN